LKRTDGSEATEEVEMDHKGNRRKEWAANGKVNEVPEWDEISGGNDKLDKDKFNNLMEWLYAWARDMHAWGQDVRDDIVRLEGHAGFATGDPGDPPDGPPGDD
jgi:hypothetical protein